MAFELEAIDTSQHKHYCDPTCSLYHPVLDWLFIGGATGVGSLLEAGVNTSVISIGAKHVQTSSPTAGTCISQRTIIDLLDDVNEDVLVHVDEVLAFVASNVGKPTIIHCMHGKSRSAALLAAIIMVLTKEPADECIRFVAACRPCIGMNWGFYAQLKLLEALLASDTRRLPPPLGFSITSPSPGHVTPCARLPATSGLKSSPGAVYRLWASSAMRHRYGRSCVAFNEVAFSTASATPLARLDSTLDLEAVMMGGGGERPEPPAKTRGMFVYPSEEATVPADPDTCNRIKDELTTAMEALDAKIKGKGSDGKGVEKYVTPLLEPAPWQVFTDTAAEIQHDTQHDKLDSHWICCGKCGCILATNLNVVLLHAGAPSYGSCGAIFVEPLMWMIPPDMLDRTVLEAAAGRAADAWNAARGAKDSVSATPAPKQRKYYAMCLDAMRPGLNPIYITLDGLKAIEGKLTCPSAGCGAKVGSYAWNGITCPCGDFVAPAFYLSAGKVIIRPSNAPSAALTSP